MSQTTSISSASTRKPRKKALRSRQQLQNPVAPMCLHAVEAGEWISTDVLYEQICTALIRNPTVLLDVTGVEHLSGSTLQLLLALHARKMQNGEPGLSVSGVSKELSRWFGYAGAAFLIPADGGAE